MVFSQTFALDTLKHFPGGLKSDKLYWKRIVNQITAEECNFSFISKGPGLESSQKLRNLLNKRVVSQIDLLDSKVRNSGACLENIYDRAFLKKLVNGQTDSLGQKKIVFHSKN